MLYPTRAIELSLRDNEHCKRLKDPSASNIYHLEAWLPFTEAAKLDRGNANVRPASERKKPFKDMTETVENDPASFHLKNRGIIYRCEKFEYDNSRHVLRLTVPNVPPEDLDDLENDDPRFGVADGGHTFRVITETVARLNELKEKDGWVEPFVRVHFLAGESFESGKLEELVEALNTSSQVQQYTLDEYRNEFDELKDALTAGGFDISQIAFTENDDQKEWNIREIIQRMACFLKDRWKHIQPTSMYKSKGKALDLYANPETRIEFQRLYPVVFDIVTLPELIESEFSIGDSVKNKKFGKLRAVKSLKKAYTRPGTTFQTEHQMDLAASLPIAAAFRELLELRGDVYRWKVAPKEALKHSAEELYRALVSKSKTARSVNTLGSDTEYWTQTVNIVLRAKDDILARQLA